MGLRMNVSPTDEGRLLCDYAEGVLGNDFDHEEVSLRAQGNLLRMRQIKQREAGSLLTSRGPCPRLVSTYLQVTRVGY